MSEFSIECIGLPQAMKAGVIEDCFIAVCTVYALSLFSANSVRVQLFIAHGNMKLLLIVHKLACHFMFEKCIIYD